VERHSIGWFDQGESWRNVLDRGGKLGKSKLLGGLHGGAGIRKIKEQGAQNQLGKEDWGGELDRVFPYLSECRLGKE